MDSYIVSANTRAKAYGFVESKYAQVFLSDTFSQRTWIQMIAERDAGGILNETYSRNDLFIHA